MKSPLAAEIKEPGRAYLQVGNNEIFELFQSAYSGGSATKGDDSSQKDFKVYNIGIKGRTDILFEKKKVNTDKDSETELESIVNYIADQSNNIEKLPNICLPSLPDVITYSQSDNKEDKELKVPIGIYDDPDHQYQGAYMLDIGRENTLLLGSSQMGKTNLLQLCVRHLVSQNTPEEVVFYILDFGSMVLKNLQSLRHIGGLVIASEDEKVKNLFKLLLQEMDERKNKLMNVGVSSFFAYKEAGFSDMTKIYVLIDNYNAFKELYMEEYEQSFLRICRDGISLGISVIITNTSTTGIGYRHLSNFSNRICFTCNDSSEYSSVLDRCRMEPKNVPGRMLFQLDKEIYEAQTYLAFEGEKEIDRAGAMKEFVNVTNEKYIRYREAKKIPVIPDTLYWKEFKEEYEIQDNVSELPLGLDFATIEPVYLSFDEDCEYAVISRKKERSRAFIEQLVNNIQSIGLKSECNIYIIDGLERQLVQYKGNPLVIRYSIDVSEIEIIFERLIKELGANKEGIAEGDSTFNMSHNVIILNSKEVIEYISKTKPVLDLYKEIVETYKNYGVLIIFGNVENTTIPYSGPELLKRIKDNRKAIILDNLNTIKIFDIPSVTVRRFVKPLLDDEGYVINGSDIVKIKMFSKE